ncbi:MAG TPA: hypothetical protein VGN52_09745 [Burkholderiales bacterium]|jgi:hypothetical protein
MQIPQDNAIAHPAFAESAVHLSHLLRGLVSRWETLDAAPEALAPPARVKAWRDSDAVELPRAYERI